MTLAEDRKYHRHDSDGKKAYNHCAKELHIALTDTSVEELAVVVES